MHSSLSPGAQALATNVQQNCTSSTATGGSTKPSPTSVSNASTLNNLWNDHKFLFIFIFILLLVSIALTIYLLAGSDTSDQSDNIPIQ